MLEAVDVSIVSMLVMLCITTTVLYVSLHNNLDLQCIYYLIKCGANVLVNTVYVTSTQ